MIVIMKLIGVIILSALIALIIVVVYVKALSILGGYINKKYGDSIRARLVKYNFITRYGFTNISNTRGNTKTDSRIEVGFIYCFDSTYKCLHANWCRICRVVKNFIRDKPICDKTHNSNSKCNSEYYDTNIKSFLHKTNYLLRLAFFGSFLLLSIYAISVLFCLAVLPSTTIHIVSIGEPIFYIALSIMALSGLLLILLLEQQQAESHYKQAAAKENPISPSIPNPLVSGHNTRRDEPLIVLNKVNSLYATDNSKHQTSNKKPEPYPFTHKLPSLIKLIIERLKSGVNHDRREP